MVKWKTHYAQTVALVKSLQVQVLSDLQKEIKMNEGSMEIVLKNRTKINLFYDERLFQDLKTAYIRKNPGDTITIPLEVDGVCLVEIEFIMSELDFIRLTRNETIRFGETVLDEKAME